MPLRRSRRGADVGKSATSQLPSANNGVPNTDEQKMWLCIMQYLAFKIEDTVTVLGLKFDTQFNVKKTADLYKQMREVDDEMCQMVRDVGTHEEEEYEDIVREINTYALETKDKSDLSNYPIDPRSLGKEWLTYMMNFRIEGQYNLDIPTITKLLCDWFDTNFTPNMIFEQWTAMAAKDDPIIKKVLDAPIADLGKLMEKTTVALDDIEPEWRQRIELEMAAERDAAIERERAVEPDSAMEREDAPPRENRRRRGSSAVAKFRKFLGRR